MKTDIELRNDVLAELRWEPKVNAGDIGVIVKNGVVTLTGNIDSYAEKWAAEKATERVSGVLAIANEIDVRLAGSGERTDADIAAAAVNALKWTLFVPHDRIKVVVENGWITLDGEVEWQYQKNSAFDAVYGLIGVKGVLNRITIKSRISPEDIKKKIETAFQRNAQLDAQKITVSVNQGKVTLLGSVHSWAERDEASTAAWAAPGVSEVVNNVTVAPW
jgi:osmotically-inducible protein OsmY